MVLEPPELLEKVVPVIHEFLGEETRCFSAEQLTIDEIIDGKTLKK